MSFSCCRLISPSAQAYLLAPTLAYARVSCTAAASHQSSSLLVFWATLSGLTRCWQVTSKMPESRRCNPDPTLHLIVAFKELHFAHPDLSLHRLLSVTELPICRRACPCRWWAPRTCAPCRTRTMDPRRRTSSATASLQLRILSIPPSRTCACSCQGMHYIYWCIYGQGQGKCLHQGQGRGQGQHQRETDLRM